MKSILIVAKVLRVILSISLSILLITILIRWWLGIVRDILPERARQFLRKEKIIFGRIVS